MSVSRPSPPRDHGVWPAALRRQVEEAAILDVAQLREEKAAPVAERGVVGAELVAVVAEREGSRQVVGQWGEAREVVLPLGVGQRAEADALGPALVAVAERVPREPCRLDDVVEGVAELRMQGCGTIGRGDGHPRLRYERRPTPGRKRPVRRPQSR